jgi:hypothetical protein
MNETGGHRQWGYYDWNEVYAASKRMKEQGQEKERDQKRERD